MLFRSKYWTDLYLDDLDELEVESIRSRNYFYVNSEHLVNEENTSDTEESSWADAGSEEDREKYSISEIVGKRVKIRALDNSVWEGKIVLARRSKKTRNTDEAVLVNLDYDDPKAKRFIKDDNIDLYNSDFVWVEDPNKIGRAHV